MCNMRNGAAKAASHSVWFIHLKYITELVFGQERVLAEKETKWRLRGYLKVVVIQPTRRSDEGCLRDVYQSAAPDVT